jgi:hypothetical protein
VTWRRAPRVCWPVAPLALLLLAGCGSRSSDADAVRATLTRYDELLRDGYQRQNMNFMREVASEEQAAKLYAHMAALGEGKLRLVSRLRALEFVRIDFPAEGQASAETREVWDFTHYRLETGEKYAEEEGFVYRMRYALRREKGRWLVTGADVISGEATNTVIPWPKLDRSGNALRGGAAPKPSPQ